MPAVAFLSYQYFSCNISSAEIKYYLPISEALPKAAFKGLDLEDGT
jgi:hypothetical protein